MTNGINVEQKYFLMNIQHANGVGREKNNIKRKPKISKNAICYFLLLFAAFNPEIPQERHLESKEVGSLSTQHLSFNQCVFTIHANIENSVDNKNMLFKRQVVMP